MPNLGGWEWVIILVIVILVFGVGRIAKVGEELGRGVRSFREGVREEQDGDDETDEDQPAESKE